MGAAIAGMVGGAAGGQALSDVAGSALSAYMANRETNQAWQRQKAIFKSRYTWMMGDLKRAGLNPILAAGSGLGAGGGSPPQTSAIPSGKTSNYVASAREAALLGAQLANVQANTAKTDAETAGIASQNEQREFYGKLYEKANQVLDALINRFGDAGGKAGGSILDLFVPENNMNSGKSAGEAEKDYLGDEGRQDRIDAMKRRGTRGLRGDSRGHVEEWY